MKKYLVLILFILCLGIIVVKKGLNNEYDNEISLGDNAIVGDVDDSGSVTAQDYLIVKKHIMKKKILTGSALSRADVNGDGSVTASDYVTIKKIIIGGRNSNSSTKNDSAISNDGIINNGVDVKVNYTVKLHACDSVEITAGVSNLGDVDYSLDKNTWTTANTFTIKKDGKYRIYAKGDNGTIYESSEFEVKLIPDSLRNGKISATDLNLKKGRGSEAEAISNTVAFNEALYCAHKIGVTELMLETGNYYFGPNPKGNPYYAPKTSFQGDEFIRVSNPKLNLNLYDSTLYVYPNNIANYRLIRVRLNEDLTPPDGSNEYKVYIKNGTLIGDREEHKCAKSNKLLKAECAYDYKDGYKGYYGTVCKSDDLPSHQSGVGIDIMSNNVVIWKMKIKDMTADGIYVANQGTYDKVNKKINYDHTTLIDNNVISNCRRDGISIILGKDISITNNYIYGMNGTESEVGIDIEQNTKDQYQENVTISGNHIYGNAGRASIVVHAEVKGYLKILNNYLGDQVVYHKGHDNRNPNANEATVRKITTISGNTKYTANGAENCVCNVNDMYTVTNSYAAILCSGCVRKTCDAKSIMKNTWFQNNSKRYYLGDNGKKVTGPKWQQVGSSWYYLDNDGAATTGWKQITWSGGTSWFYFNDQGVMQTGWQQITWSGGTSWFYFDKTDGYMYANKTVKIDGDSFTFNSNGVCVSGTGC